MDIDEAFDGINNLKEWKLDKRVKQRIKDSGFDGLLRLTTFPVNHDLPLLSALVESYDVKSRCFVFNGYKLVFGLEDVLYITGLPVDGNPVTGIDSKGNELCMKYLGRNVCDETRKGLTNSAWLRNNFEVVPETIDQDSPEIEPYVRAFLLYLIGSIVVPSYHGTNVPVMYLSLMENLQSIKDYAWGAALLAHLHISMENFKQPYSPRRKNILIGHSYSLMVFAMERIPKLLLRFCLNGANPVDDYLPTTFPLLAGWTKLLSEPSNAEEKITKQEYLQILDGLKEDDIVWQPYKRLPCDFLPQYCAGQEKIGMSRTILLCYEKAVYHRPDLSPKQFGIQEVNTNMLRPLVELELGSRFGRKGKNWGTYGKYGYYKEEWESRASCLIIESAEEDPGPHSFEALTTLPSQTPNDPDPQSAKRKTLDHTKKTSGILVDTYGPTNSLPSWNAMHPEPQLVPSIESRSFDLIDVAPLDATQPPSIGVFLVESNQEEPATICPSNSSSSLHHFHSELFPTAGSHKLLDELSSLEADVIELLRGSVTHHSDVRPTTMQAAVESAKETIRGILCQGFDALTNSEMQEAFFASSEVLLSADVFPCAHLKTRLTVFRNELRENATAFLQAQTAIDTASEFSSLQEFLEVQAVKIPALQERLGVAAKKIAHLRAILDAAVERQTKMDKVLAAFVDKTKIAKQKLASLNPQAADIESKKQAAVKVVEQCKSSWVDLSTSLFRFL
ncbi:serine/threonine-protein phosphatase 7 long form homolog isoform X2 [Prunus avium]|uniref:Serine/threonine-protein phosphatase 7 long form homolog isoform X2 n=1 Tax=Prunus avium TaxID=42229 RepID=A0A6P5T6C6_PRUAV|nr:serine/threonine-protein phosphatase 7 long form homolog isoform X2 [Prunus avium]